MTIVPNSFPAQVPATRLAIVAEAPGGDEELWHICPACHLGTVAFPESGKSCPRQGCPGTLEPRPTPLVGASGRLLNKLLAEVGIRREDCFVGNVSQQRPSGNDFNKFDWDGPEVQAGILALREDLARFQPQFVLCLGNASLHLLKHGNLTPPRKKEKKAIWHNWPSKVSLWRGTLFQSEWAGVKAMGTYHPAALLRSGQTTWPFVVRADLRRAKVECNGDPLRLPERTLTVDHGFDALLGNLKALRDAQRPISADLEGSAAMIECISFAPHPNLAFVLPFTHTDGTSYWPEDQEIALVQALKDLLEDPSVPKCFHNGASDAFKLLWHYGIACQGVVDDTMFAAWELYCEMDKDLGFLGSLWTREPAWKQERTQKEAKDE